MCKRNIDLSHPSLRTWPTTQAYALTGNRTDDLLVHCLAVKPLSHTSQGICGLFFLILILQKFVSSYSFYAFNNITMLIVDEPTECSKRIPDSKRIAMTTIFLFGSCKQILSLLLPLLFLLLVLEWLSYVPGLSLGHLNQALKLLC